MPICGGTGLKHVYLSRRLLLSCSSLQRMVMISRTRQNVIFSSLVCAGISLIVKFVIVHQKIKLGHRLLILHVVPNPFDFLSLHTVPVLPRTTNSLRVSLSSGNAKESLALMPAYKARERLMLRALHRYGSGQEGCIRGWLSLPHSMRVFYLHSYCSRVWNEAAKYRLQTLGFKPVQGDLVWAGSEKGLKDTTEELNAPQVMNLGFS